MKWSKIRLILVRELRDQLRDRRTLFMIIVLPVLLYPFMGMAIIQVTQFLKENPSRVLVLGLDELSFDPPLVSNGRIPVELFRSTDSSRLLEITVDDQFDFQSSDTAAAARGFINDGKYDAVIHFPAGFAGQMDDQSAIRRNTARTASICAMLTATLAPWRRPKRRLKQ